MRFSDAIRNYTSHLEIERSAATVKGYHGALMQFCLYMRNPLVTQIYPEQVDAYFRELLELGWKRNSLTAKSMAFRKFFQYWKRKGYPVLEWEILPIIQKTGVIPRVANQAALSQLLEQAAGDDLYDLRNRAIILLFADGGMRNGELCALNTDIDTDTFTFSERCTGCGDEISFESKLSTMATDLQSCNRCRNEQVGDPCVQGVLKQFSSVLKTEKRRGGVIHRRVFWYTEANDALKKWMLKRKAFCDFFNVRDQEALFIGVKTWRAGYRMRPGTVGLMLRDLSLSAGIEPVVNAHSIRHMFGFEAAELGANNSNISDLMGHSQIQSSYVYTHLRGPDLGLAHKRVKSRPDRGGGLGIDKMSIEERHARVEEYGTSSKDRTKQGHHPQAPRGSKEVDVLRTR